MLLYAVLADIHANFAALEAVASDARALAVAEQAELVFLCLGDVVDYGPQPNECVAWVRDHAAAVVIGNHDQAALVDRPPIDIDPQLWPILLWSRHELDHVHKATISQWPLVSILQPFTLFHSSLVEINGYIDNPRSARDNLTQMTTTYGLFGHTHIACCYVQAMPQPALWLESIGKVDLQTPAAAAVIAGIWHDLPDSGRRVLLNPGSVGQPRRHALLTAAGLPRDNRASYLLLREIDAGRWQASFRRVIYPVERTIQLLRAIRWRGAATPPIDDHPFSQQLAAIRSRMPEALPLTVELLIAQLRP